jgi:LPXTG-site transpeptidase (sortase) family protein
LRVAGALAIGLGLLLSLAAAGSALWDARQPATPFDQVDGGGSSAEFVPIIAPQVGAAPTLPPDTIAVNGLAPTVLPAASPTSGPAGPTRITPATVVNLATAVTPPSGVTAATATAPPGATQASIAIPDRIIIPAIELNAPAVPAKLKDIEYQGKPYQQWLAPDSFSAGWLTSSATLGVPGNTVLSGHNNLFGEVFGHLQDLRVGDLILAYSGARQFAYVIVLKMILPERFEPLSVRLVNAEWIQPSTDERLTLVTCWPYESNTHRLIIVARPLSLDRVALAADAVTPRLTPHPPLSWLSTPNLPPTNAP